MKIAVIGTGYVGLVSGACFSEFGHTVTCVDKDAGKINRLLDGIMPIYEPGLDSLVERNTAAGRLFFTTDLEKAMDGAEAVFIAVGTPSRRGDGHADLQYVFAAVEELAVYIKAYTVIVTKSTVPVGTGAAIKKRVSALVSDDLFGIASNPEFLREGAAIEDFMRPDRVVVGIECDQAKTVMQELYRPLFLSETPVVFTNRETAEIIKYAANAFLATKISFINEMADLCEKVGADVRQVAKGIGLDNRIGGKFLHAGPGFGGSCFPKDTRALVQSAETYDVPMKIVRSVVEVNEERKLAMAGKIVQACGGSVENKHIALLGLTFKPNTDDMRESPSLDIISKLQALGAEIHAHDPKGMEEAAEMLTDIHFHDDPYSAMEGADALVIVTEWNQFRALDLNRVHELLAHPVLVDLRNIYGSVDMAALGFDYSGIGR